VPLSFFHKIYVCYIKEFEIVHCCTDLWKHSHNTDTNIFVTIFRCRKKMMMVYISSVIRSDIDSEKEITACLLANEA